MPAISGILPSMAQDDPEFNRALADMEHQGAGCHPTVFTGIRVERSLCQDFFPGWGSGAPPTPPTCYPLRPS